MNRRFIITVCILSAIIIGAWTYLIGTRSYTDERIITVTTAHVSELTIKTSDGNVAKTIKNPSANTDIVVPKNSSTVEYRAITGYKDGVVRMRASDYDIVIRPQLDTSKLSEIPASSFTDIQTLINASYPEADKKYHISNATTVTDDWMVVKLTSVNREDKNDLNTDQLKIILKKKDQSWEIAAKPDILFNTYKNDTILVEVLRAANEY